MIKLSDFKAPNIENLIALAVFGSYGTEFWDKNRSDIDILVLLNYRIGPSDEFNIEDTLTPLLQKYFGHNHIHLTFIYLNEFASDFAKQYINSTNKLIINPLKEIDFRMYVNKHRRENQWIQNMIDKDMKILRGN